MKQYDSQDYLRRRIIKKENYQDQLRRLKQTQKRYTSEVFPPNKKSLGCIENLPPIVYWKRIPDILETPRFMSQQIHPTDVVQGKLGDCTILAALAGMTKNPESIVRLFQSTQINPHGIYMVRLSFKRKIRQIIVDDYIPVDKNNKPLFAQFVNGTDIWVVLLQKAWATLHGSYAQIDKGGNNYQALKAFTTAPTLNYSIVQYRSCSVPHKSLD